MKQEKRQQVLAEGWKYPIGTPVVVKKDDGDLVKTKTRSEVDLLGGRAVIWLEGISGCYALDRVSPAEVIEEVQANG